MVIFMRDLPGVKLKFAVLEEMSGGIFACISPGRRCA